MLSGKINIRRGDFVVIHKLTTALFMCQNPSAIYSFTFKMASVFIVKITKCTTAAASEVSFHDLFTTLSLHVFDPFEGFSWSQ